jgi:hypothetical protein
MWLNEYLLEVHGEARGAEIIADIDHRYASQGRFDTVAQLTICWLAYQQYPHFQDCDAFPMAATSRNGLVMIRKP